MEPPDKSAVTAVALSAPLASRWSPRAFSDRPVEPEKVLRLLEAVRWAPSSRNLQPWRLVLTRSDQPEAHARLVGCLTGRNQLWAGRAPLLMLMVTALESEPGRPNRMARHDVGIAFGLLAIEATAAGLAVHPMGGFDQQQARDSFGIPDDYAPVICIACGYRGSATDLPEELQSGELAPRKRRPLSELVFAERWGQPAPEVD